MTPVAVVLNPRAVVFTPVALLLTPLAVHYTPLVVVRKKSIKSRILLFGDKTTADERPHTST